MFKDEVLIALSRKGNVARFVSHDPNLKIRCAAGATSASALLAKCGRVNIRSFIPGDHQSKEFVYDVRDTETLNGHLSRLSAQGLYTIVNELIDTNDGGVSGVKQGDRIEFAPDDTPRCVEKPGTCALSEELGRSILRTVYRAELLALKGRFEFSVHPYPCGTRHENVILWEHEADAPDAPAPSPSWPNRFSRHLGDKAFGLLIADAIGLRVPGTTVLSRRLAPFAFGGGGEGTWVRTCPTEQQPGLYTTVRGWTDPFALLAAEDPEGNAIASVLIQSGVPAKFSGAAITTADGELVIEGKAGCGDDFMLGAALPEQLPARIRRAVAEVAESVGQCRFEWVYDGREIWVVQLHSGASCSSATALVPGDAEEWIELDTANLADLRSSLESVPEGAGVILNGRFGLTSHIADVVRKAGHPARMAA